MLTRVLIADDEELERRALRKILEAEGGWELHEAGNGLEALTLIESLAITVVLLDIKMPGLDGISVAERLREKHPDIAIVFLTAYDQFDYARSALRLHVDEFLLKPAAGPEVLAALKAIQARVASREGERLSSLAALERLEDAITLVAQRMRHDLSEGLTDQDQVQKFLQLQNLTGHSVSVLECRTTQPGAPLGHVVRLLEAFLADGETLALAGAKGETVRVLRMGDVSPSEPMTLLRKLRALVRTETGVSLVIGMALASNEAVHPNDLITSAHRAATLANPSNPILVVAVGSEGPRRETVGLPPLVAKSLALMEARLAEDLSLDEVAAAVGLSPSHLSRQLARATGNGFADCLAHFRIAKAKAYLADSAQTIKAVSLLVGYHDPAYFSRVFRRLEGCSPADFRSENNPLEAPKSNP